jgi:hypothetical protein
MAAPPTITVLSLAIEGPTKDAVIISAAIAPAESSEIRFDMGHLLYESKSMSDADRCRDLHQSIRDRRIGQPKLRGAPKTVSGIGTDESRYVADRSPVPSGKSTPTQSRLPRR